MCSSQSNDDPTTYDAPEPTRPRTYRLSGDRPATPVERHAMDTRRGSVALAVLGEMLSELEDAAGPPPNPEWVTRILDSLREARDRVAAAEAAL